MNIALLDDDQDIADLVRLWLTEAGHTVEHLTAVDHLVKLVAKDALLERVQRLLRMPRGVDP